MWQYDDAKLYKQYAMPNMKDNNIRSDHNTEIELQKMILWNFPQS